MNNIRTGQGIDFHRLESGLDLWIGGVRIPSDRGAVAYSDGDVLLHSICDALLGAAGLGDIGKHFPDTDPEFYKIDSKILLQRTFGLIVKKGYRLINLDSTVCLEIPRIAEFIPEMRRVISAILEAHPENISIKATTTEKMGFTGRGEGIVAMAVVLIRNY